MASILVSTAACEPSTEAVPYYQSGIDYAPPDHGPLVEDEADVDQPGIPPWLVEHEDDTGEATTTTGGEEPPSPVNTPPSELPPTTGTGGAEDNGDALAPSDAEDSVSDPGEEGSSEGGEAPATGGDPDPVADGGDGEVPGDPAPGDGGGTDAGPVDPPEEIDPGPEIVKVCSAPPHMQDAKVLVQQGVAECSYPDSWDIKRHAAVDQYFFDNSAMCGACLKVQGPKGWTVVRVIDRCKECNQNQIQLSQTAFSEVAAGQGWNYTPVTWHIASCEPEGNVEYHFKPGSSPYWTGVQVRNARNPVAVFEFSKNGQSFQHVDRENYGYFVEPMGMGDVPLTFRVTDIYGNVVMDSGIEIVPDGTVVGSSQFPPCP